jgi:hypothetical protein
MTYKVGKHPAIETPLSDPAIQRSPMVGPNNKLLTIPEKKMAEAVEGLPDHEQQALIEPFGAGKPDAMLEKAIQEHNYLAAKFVLLKGGVDLEESSHFMLAWKLGQFDIVELLAKHGADITGLLEEACSKGDLEGVDFLIKCGADANGTPLLFFVNDEFNSGWAKNADEFYPLIEALSAPAKQRLPVMARLVEAKADIDRRGREGKTPLHHAVENKQFDEAFFLLRHGADPTMADNRGRRALPTLLQCLPGIPTRFGQACADGNLGRAMELIDEVASLARWSPSAAQTLVRLNRLAEGNDDLAEHIHNALMKYWEAEANPPEEVVLFAMQHHAMEEIARLEEWFAGKGLAPRGGLTIGSFAFTCVTSDYSSNDHGAEAIQYACAWALNQAAPMWRAIDILTFVANQAVEQNASEGTFEALRGAVAELQPQLSSVPALKARADELEKQLPAILRKTQ